MGERGGDTGLSMSSALLALLLLHPPAGQPSSGGHRWVLVLRAPPLPRLSEHLNTSRGDRKCRPLIPSCLGGTPPSWTGLPKEGQRAH